MDINGLDINYKISGPDDAAHTMVILQGWGTEMGLYDSVAAAANDIYRVVQFDLPGFGASDENLFMGASFIITPCGADKKAVNALASLALEIGFGTIKVTTPEEHDRMIAFTSQLPHVLACAYVLSPSCPNHKGFSAGSYRDVSRVANINSKLWSELFLENREPLMAELETLNENLNKLYTAIKAENREELAALLERGHSVKQTLGE